MPSRSSSLRLTADADPVHLCVTDIKKPLSQKFQKLEPNKIVVQIAYGLICLQICLLVYKQFNSVDI